MAEVDLQLTPATGTAERDTVRAMRYCQTRWGFAPRRAGADKGYTAGTSSGVCVSTGFVPTSPESATGAPPAWTA